MNEETKRVFADAVKAAVAQSAYHSDLVCVVLTPEVAEVNPAKLLHWIRHFLRYNRMTLQANDFAFARSEQTLVVSPSLIKDKRNVVIRI